MKNVKVIAEYGVKTEWDKLNDWQKKSHAYTVTLKYDRRQMTVPFFMGPALSHEPTDEDVLPCLFMDASGIGSNTDFESWAHEYGYDTDSREAEKIFKQCKRNAVRLHRLLGDDYSKIAQKYEDM
jgi:hypothetical protein